MSFRWAPKRRFSFLDFALKLVAKPLTFVYKVLVQPLDAFQTARSNAEFGRQVRSIYGPLLRAHGGAVVMPSKASNSFDYVFAELVFPSVRIQVTRGRREVSVLANGVEVFSSFQEEYEAAMQRSAVRLADHWEELPMVTVTQAWRWAEGGR